MVIYCEDCERPHFSKTGTARKCLVCWKIARDIPLSKADEAHQNLSNILHTYMEENKKLKVNSPVISGQQLQQLQLENMRLSTTLGHQAHKIDALTKEIEELKKLAIPQENLKNLITLTHPDKHGGGELATRITQWLLSLRKK